MEHRRRSFPEPVSLAKKWFLVLYDLRREGPAVRRIADMSVVIPNLARMKTSVRSKSSLQCKIKSLLVARDALHALEAADCFNSVTDDGDNVSLYKPPHPLGE